VRTGETKNRLIRCCGQKFRDILRGSWFTEQIALDFRAAFGAHDRKLLHRLDAFRCGIQPKTRAQCRDGADDGIAAPFAIEIPDERSVDLDLVERETAQIDQGRVACTEVVH